MRVAPRHSSRSQVATVTISPTVSRPTRAVARCTALLSRGPWPQASVAARDESDAHRGRLACHRRKAYSIRTASPSPSSCKIRRSSVAKAPAFSAFTVTAKSRPILSSEPVRSFGRIFVPRRFQTSGGTVPTRCSVLVSAPGPGLRIGCSPGGRRGACRRAEHLDALVSGELAGDVDPRRHATARLASASGISPDPG